MTLDRFLAEVVQHLHGTVTLTIHRDPQDGREIEAYVMGDDWVAAFDYLPGWQSNGWTLTNSTIGGVQVAPAQLPQLLQSIEGTPA